MVRRTAEENRRKVQGLIFEAHVTLFWQELKILAIPSNFFSQMEEAEQRKKQEQQAEQMRNYEELVYSIKSSVAAESPESAVGKGKW